MLAKTSFSLLLFVGNAYAWGASGHEAVGYVAMQFLAPNALAFVTSSLGSTYSESLGPAATWADQVKFTTGYTWTQPYHYVDAQDNPPTSCSVDQTRDCGNGVCILDAIANYTSRVVDTSISDAQRQEALKFLDHYVGDIGQPLHVEALQVGGNAISVKCGTLTTNLHHIWDTDMINNLLKAKYNNSVPTWANSLVTRIQSGDFAANKANWISCSNTNALAKRSFDEDISEFLAGRSVQPLQCPLAWAVDSNTFDCSYVFSYTQGTDLCSGPYYNGAVPIIETQIGKQGYRLAAWLNVLFDGSTNLP